MKPKYIAIAAISIDGKIALNSKHPSDWTSKEDKVFMRALLSKCDVVVVGNNTYKMAKEPLSKRNCLVFSRSANQLISGSANLQFINPNKINIAKFMRSKKYRSIAILGGAQVYTYFLEKNLLDEIYLTIEPLIFGRGINLFSDLRTIPQNFTLSSVKKLNKQGSILLHYARL